MDKVWLQFADEALTETVGWSWWQQPLETWPYQAEVDVSDSRYIAYYDSLPPMAQQYAPTPVRPS